MESTMSAPSKSAKEIFLLAVEKTDLREREVYVGQACGGDIGVRHHVEALLRVHDEPDSLLDQEQICAQLRVAIESAATEAFDQPPLEAPGTRIGPYKLLEQIGEGGMGVVYMAEQQKPLRRMVALKIIKPGMDTKQVIARFEAERQALALMQHPHIAKVLDVGTTTTGRPYFVMELVRGLPLTDYCDQARLSVSARLELFVQVCRAVQHAHTNGIIHRDLKPSNISVTLHDDVPVPMIIDFGIAKALHGPLTERTLFTEFAQLIGTPLYMSPEQAQMSGLGIDTRSDVYSLGVLLYELLTGTTPFDQETFSKVGFDERRRIICEDDPPRVSARIGTLSGAQQTTVSARRGVDTRTLVRQTGGELDWIVMQALEKDRTRRYETASAFAADVERYLRNEPVQACPASTVYRLKKFARRNQAALIVGAVLVGTLLAGTGVSIWQAIEATGARNLADQRLVRETQARKEAETERLEADTQRQLADANFQQALEAVDQMLTRVADDTLAHIPGFEPVQRQLLEDALGFYQEFLQQRSDDPRLRFETAQAWHRVGLIRTRLGDGEQGLEAQEQAIRIVELLLREDPDHVPYLELLIDSCSSVVGALDRVAGHGPEIDVALQRGLAAGRQLEGMFPHQRRRSMDHFKLQQAHAESNRGRRSEALNLYRELLQTFRAAVADDPHDLANYPPLMFSLLNVAQSTVDKDFDEADRLLVEAVDLGEALLRADPELRTVPRSYPGSVGGDPQAMLARMLISRAVIRRGKPEAAAEEETLLRQAIALLDEFRATRPAVRGAESLWGTANSYLGALLDETGRGVEAEAVCRNMCHVLVAENRDPGLVLSAFENWARQLVKNGRRDDGQELRGLYRDFLANLELPPADSADTTLLGGTSASIRIAWRYLPGPYAHLGKLTSPAGNATDGDGQPLPSGSGRPPELRQYELLVADFSAVLEQQPEKWPLYALRASAYLALGDYPRALEDFRRAVERGHGDFLASPTNLTPRPDESFRAGFLALADNMVEHSRDKPKAYLARADLYAALGQWDQALQDWSRVIKVDPRNAAARKLRARANFGLGRFRETLADLAVAVELKELNWWDPPTLAWISPAQVAACPDESFRAGVLALADQTIERTHGRPAAYLARGNLHAAMRQLDAAQRDFEAAIAAQGGANDLRNRRAVAVAMNHVAWFLATSEQVERRDPRRAVQLAAQAVAIFPEGFTWRTLGVARFRSGDWAGALEALQKSMDLRPDEWMSPAEVAACPDESFRAGILTVADRMIELTNGSPKAHQSRASLHAAMGNLAAARKDLDVSIASPDTGSYARYQHALLCLVMHDEAACRADCAELLRQFHGSRNPNDLHFSAWTCALAPNSVDNMDEAIELARHGVEIGPVDQVTLHALGAALFRAGRFAEALETLERCDAAPPNGNFAPAYTWYFRAMTCFKLGRADEARQWYDKALAETAKLLHNSGDGNAEPVPWNHRLTLELLRDESTALLGVTAETDTRDDHPKPTADPHPQETPSGPKTTTQDGHATTSPPVPESEEPSD